MLLALLLNLAAALKSAGKSVELRSPSPVNKMFLEACAQNQMRRNLDVNGADQEGYGHFQMTADAKGNFAARCVRCCCIRRLSWWTGCAPMPWAWPG